MSEILFLNVSGQFMKLTAFQIRTTHKFMGSLARNIYCMNSKVKLVKYTAC